MELWRGFSTITSLSKKYMYFGTTQHIPLPGVVLALQLHPKTVSCGYDGVLWCPECSFPKGSLWAVSGQASWYPWAQGTAQILRWPQWTLPGVHTNAAGGFRCSSWVFLVASQSMKGRPAGHPKVTLTLCDSRLGGTCWQTEIRGN